MLPEGLQGAFFSFFAFFYRNATLSDSQRPKLEPGITQKKTCPSLETLGVIIRTFLKSQSRHLHNDSRQPNIYIWVYIYIYIHLYIKYIEGRTRDAWFLLCCFSATSTGSAAWDYVNLLCNLYRDVGPKRCHHSQTSRAKSPLNPSYTWGNMLLTELHHSPVVSSLLLPSNSSILPPLLKNAEKKKKFEKKFKTFLVLGARELRAREFEAIIIIKRVA